MIIEKVMKNEIINNRKSNGKWNKKIGKVIQNWNCKIAKLKSDKIMEM